jgi:voltage-gated potassium channel
VISAAFALVVFSSIAMLTLERDIPGATITTAEDALWWAIATITTVGHGDCYPITGEGRAVASIMMTAGVGLFGTLSGVAASWFMSPHGVNPATGSTR